jgi:hypothetical protein
MTEKELSLKGFLKIAKYKLSNSNYYIKTERKPESSSGKPESKKQVMISFFIYISNSCFTKCKINYLTLS